jgi:hypothetical protein
MKNQIGIGILDIYEEADVINCLKSLPKDIQNVLIVSDTKNKIETNYPVKKYGNGVSLATMRNWILSQFRLKELKHFFIIGSNQSFDKDIFEDVIKRAEVFGTWCIMGPAKPVVSIEDDQTHLNLEVSNVLNTDFIYIFNGIVSNIGYFDERYFNTKDLDVLDYVLRMRSKGVYTPNNYHPVYNEGILSSNSPIKKINYREMQNPDQSVHYSYAYFVTKYQYIPTQNDPPPVSQDDLLKSLEDLQNKYSKNDKI